MASLLSLTSFYLFSIMYCSTSYCVPIEGIGESEIYGKLEVSNEYSVLPTFACNLIDLKYLWNIHVFRIPGPSFGSLVEICREFNQRRYLKAVCLICTGFSLSCFLPVPTTALPTTTTAATTTTTSVPTTTTTTSTTSTTTSPPAEDA